MLWMIREYCFNEHCSAMNSLLTINLWKQRNRLCTYSKGKKKIGSKEGF